jgi:chitin synthase
LTFSSLPSIAEDTILATLRERYLASLPYTSISSTTLISVNPHVYIPLNGDASLQDYVAEYYRSAVDDDTLREGAGAGKERLSPHIFRLGLSAYYNMKRTKQDQIMVMR